MKRFAMETFFRFYDNKKRLNIFLYAFNTGYRVLTSTLVPGINYFVFKTHPLHHLKVRKRSSSSCYMIETYNTRHHFPVIEP